MNSQNFVLDTFQTLKNLADDILWEMKDLRELINNKWENGENPQGKYNKKYTIWYEIQMINIVQSEYKIFYVKYKW